jgi:biofilm PGA synthesis N-glycosyltransferase PgaC
MTIFFIMVFVGYSICVLILAFGWARLSDEMKSQPVTRQNFISVVIPFRNERSTIVPLINSLQTQNYPNKNFEVIFVDDHSEDDSVDVIQKNISGEIFKVIQLVSPHTLGKKAALDFAIRKAHGVVIAATDADCVVPRDWLTKINAWFQNEETKLVVGPVRLHSNNSFLSRLQALEFSSLIGVTGATIGFGWPTMSNGANLSFRKEAYEKVGGYGGNFEIPSGDDEFLMRKISAQWKNAIRFLSDPDSIVSAMPQLSVGAFIQQRLRWAGKWKFNSSLFTQFVALAVLCFQFTFILSFVWTILNGFHSKAMLSLWILKMFAEMIFLFQVSSFLSVRWRWISFFALQFVYPLYVVSIGVLSQLKGYEWKNRNWK